MVDMVVRSFIETLRKNTEEYFTFYPFYLPSVYETLDIFGKEQYLFNYLSKLNINDKSNVLFGYDRGALQVTPNTRGFKQTAVMNSKNDPKLTAVFNDVLYGTLELDGTFYSQDVLDIEVIENLHFIKFSREFPFVMKFKIEDALDVIEFKYIVKYEFGGNKIELISLKDLGSFWSININYQINGIFMSIENSLYPKIKDIYTTLFVDSNINKTENIPKECMCHTEYIRNDNGNVIGLNFEIFNYKDLKGS